MVKPFAEAGVSGGDGGGGDLLWGAGARARGCFDSGRLRWTLGGAAASRSGGGDRSLVEHYSQLAAFADVQTRLDFTVGGLATRAGVFAGYRFLTDATLRVQPGDGLRRELLRWRDLVAALYVAPNSRPGEHYAALRALLQLSPAAAKQIPFIATP